MVQVHCIQSNCSPLTVLESCIETKCKGQEKELLFFMQQLNGHLLSEVVLQQPAWIVLNLPVVYSFPTLQQVQYQLLEEKYQKTKAILPRLVCPATSRKSFLFSQLSLVCFVKLAYTYCYMYTCKDDNNQAFEHCRNLAEDKKRTTKEQSSPGCHWDFSYEFPFRENILETSRKPQRCLINLTSNRHPQS